MIKRKANGRPSTDGRLLFCNIRESEGEFTVVKFEFEQLPALGAGDRALFECILVETYLLSAGGAGDIIDDAVVFQLIIAGISFILT